MGAMTAVTRGGHLRGAAARAAALATVLAIAGVGCSSPAQSAAPPSPSTTTTPAPGAQPANATGPRVIIDTDLSRWWDDATVLGLANVLQQQGAVNVLGVVSDVRNPIAVAAIDAINTAYGHGDIPVGAVAYSDADTAKHGYTDVLVRRLPHS